jgi:hypothetical protein
LKKGKPSGGKKKCVYCENSWAPSSDSCTTKDKSTIVLSATTYVTSEANCTVYWVSKTAGVNGSIYSARMMLERRRESGRADIHPSYFSDTLWTAHDRPISDIGGEFYCRANATFATKSAQSVSAAFILVTTAPKGIADEMIGPTSSVDDPNPLTDLRQWMTPTR